jgi:hypothetical protein
MLILAVSACGVVPNERVPDIPAKSIIWCGLDRVTPALSDSPNALQRAAKVYDLIDRGWNVVDAVQYAYVKDLYDMGQDELNEAILILSGLDDCGEASPELKTALLGVIGTHGP